MLLRFYLTCQWLHIQATPCRFAVCPESLEPSASQESRHPDDSCKFRMCFDHHCPRHVGTDAYSARTCRSLINPYICYRAICCCHHKPTLRSFAVTLIATLLGLVMMLHSCLDVPAGAVFCIDLSDSLDLTTESQEALIACIINRRKNLTTESVPNSQTLGLCMHTSEVEFLVRLELQKFHPANSHQSSHSSQAHDQR